MLNNKSHTIERLLLRRLSKKIISEDRNVVLDYWGKYVGSDAQYMDILPYRMFYFIGYSGVKGRRYSWVIEGEKNFDLGTDKNGQTKRYINQKGNPDVFWCQSLEEAHQRCVDDFEEQIKIRNKGRK